MSRCSVCDYTPEDGSPLLDKAPSHGIQVLWNSDYGDFLCTDCKISIGSAINDFRFKDKMKNG
jgi:hypothetical protein